MRTFSLLWSPLTAVCLLTTAGSALAHDPPRTYQLAFTTDDASEVPLLISNRGMFRDEGDTWSLVCNEAYGVNISNRPALLQRAGGDLLLATFAGVLVSSDGGCTYTDVSPEPDIKASAVRAPDALPGTVFVASGNDEADNALYRSDDFGKTWTKLFSNPENEWFNGLRVSPTNPMRMYATGKRIDLEAMALLDIWGRSDDGGATWQTRVLDRTHELVEVHPSEPDVVFTQERTNEAGAHTLWRSADGGDTFEEAFDSPTDFTSLAVAPDNASLWLGGGRGGGLYTSSNQGVSFTALDDDIAEVHCLRWQGDRLYLCANRLPNLDGVWWRDANNDEWTPLVTAPDVTERASCPRTSDEGICEVLWSDWEYEFLPMSSPDAGMTDAGATPREDAGADAGAPDASDADAGAGPDAALQEAGGSDPDFEARASTSGGCSVSVLPASTGVGHWWMALLSLASLYGVYARRRTRARKAPRACDASS